MDSITHLVLGATVGEILAGKKLGKKAMLIGALANNLSDLDFIAGSLMSPSQYFLAHRGFTHSFLFIVIASVLLAWTVNKFSSFKVNIRYWAIFFFIQLLSHLLLDSLNAYGIGWFEPFSHERISYDVLFVADPFFTVWLSISCIVLLILPKQTPSRIRWAIAGIILSIAYTAYAMINKSMIKHVAQKTFAHQQITPSQLLITPTPLNCWLWCVVADAGDRYFIGYHSVFDQSAVEYQSLLKNDSLINSIRYHDETQQLIRLARGFYTIDKHNDTLVFNNLRFGQINGWENPRAAFIFSYNLGKQNSLFTIQKGRFSGWNKQAIKSFINRIEGN